MKAIIIKSTFGYLAFNEQNFLLEKALFSKKPEAAAKQLLETESGKIPQEIVQLVRHLQNYGYDYFVFEDPTYAKETESELTVKTEVSRPSQAGEYLRSRIEQIAVEAGFAENEETFKQWLHDVTTALARLRIKAAIEKRDLLVAQAILTLDDLDKVINLFMGRMREWYGIHFPELDRLVEKHETYARLVLELGQKENFRPEKLEKEEIPEQKAKQIVKSAETSLGADLSDSDLAQIQSLSKDILDLYKLREKLEDYLDDTMSEVAPNMKSLVGSLLGARLIALAGGLENLARKPASTIQVLGAEKALFRSLKTGARPPKHGLIFQDTLLHDAKRWQRGKIARALAGKLAIAARADAFGGRLIGDELRVGLDKRIKEIQDKYSEPPPIPERRIKPAASFPNKRSFNKRRRHGDKWRKRQRER